jgi:hypothetical protein
MPIAQCLLSSHAELDDDPPDYDFVVDDEDDIYQDLCALRRVGAVVTLTLALLFHCQIAISNCSLLKG